MTGERYDRGLEMRRRVLGEDHVRRSLEGATDFTHDFQDLATEYCWGALWARPGMEPAVRSLLNIGILAALGRGEELRMHVGGALRNGVAADDIKEALLQVAVYCGIPAANDAFRVARAALEEHGHGG